jgi:putative membrane protein
MISAFAILLPKHLRDEITERDLAEVVVEEELELVKSAFHKPLAVMRSLSSKVQSLRADNKLSHEQFLTLSQNLNELIDALGGMERIKKTPIPFSYAMLIKRFIAAYVFSLPLGLVRDFGWASVVIVPFVFYVMVGIEVIAEAIENPFGKDKDDLPTDDIAQNIARNVKEVLNSAYSEPVKEKVEGEVFAVPKKF